MGKSFRKTDMIGNGYGHHTSEKYDKRLCNKTLRHKVKDLIRIYPDTEIFPAVREVSNVWDFCKDGKSWFGNIPYASSTTYPHARYFDDPYWVKLYRRMKSK